MNNKEVLQAIKRDCIITPDDKVFERILSEASSLDHEKARVRTVKRPLFYKPVLVFFVLVLCLASTLAVTAAVNEDVREYLVSIFGGNPNPVKGELIGTSAQSDGVKLTVDAIVSEGNSIFMIYSLTDENRVVFSDNTSINKFKFSVGDDSNYSATYNTVIKNGSRNYMILNGNNLKKGTQKLKFTLESLKTPDPEKTFTVPAGTSDFIPQGITGYSVDYVSLKSNRIEASFTLSNPSEYTLNYDIKVKNLKTGMTFSQKAEFSRGDANGKTTNIIWYSDVLDGGDPSDYVLILPFDKIYTFEKPLDVEFTADLSRDPIKIIVPTETFVLDYKVDKVTVHQMSVMVDISGDPYKGDESSGEPIKADTAEKSEDFFTKDPIGLGISGQKLEIKYDNGVQADTISGSMTMTGNNKYRCYLILNGSLDFTKKPVLFIGDTQIKLY